MANGNNSNLATTPLAGIAPGSSPPATTDQIVGVQGGRTDALWTLAQIAQSVGVFRTTVRLYDAQLEILAESPIQIVPAQGAGTIIVVLGSYFVWNGPGYEFGGPFQIAYANQNTPSVDEDGFYDPSTIDQPITISNFNGDYSGGSGNTLVTTVLWIVVPAQ